MDGTYLPRHFFNNFIPIQRPILNGTQLMLKLNYFTKTDSKNNEQLFFVESYGKNTIRGRWICAIEAAIRFSELPVKVIMTTSYLSLSSPHLRDLYLEFYPSKVMFYTIDVPKLFVGLPIEGMLSELNYTNMHTYTHISDLMRAAILFKYGGFYLDFDALTLSSLKSHRNCVSMEGYSKPSENCSSAAKQRSNLLNNGVMQFEAGNKFMWSYLAEAKRSYKPDLREWDVGETTMSRAAVETLNLTKGSSIHNYLSTELSILPSSVFLFLGDNGAPFRSFYTNFTSADWQERIACSSVLHLSGQRSKNARISGDPRRDIYSYIGPKVCPTAFSNLTSF